MKNRFLFNLLCVGVLAGAPLAKAGYSTAETHDSPYATYEEQTQNNGYSPGLTFKPSQLNYELLGNMGASRTSGHADIQTLSLLANLIQQDKTATFGFGLDFIYRMTWLHSNTPTIESKELYSVGANFSASYALGNPETRLFGGVTASLDSDFHSVVSDAFQFGARAGISFRVNDQLTMQTGLYYSPQLAAYPIVPLICIQYTLNNDWRIEMDPIRLRFVNTVSDTFSWAPFVGMTGGSWNVKENDRYYLFSTLSGVAGIQTNWKVGSWGSYKPVIATELGFTFSTRMDYYSSNGNDHYSRTNFDSGLYLKTGLKLEF